MGQKQFISYHRHKQGHKYIHRHGLTTGTQLQFTDRKVVELQTNWGSEKALEDRLQNYDEITQDEYEKARTSPI